MEYQGCVDSCIQFMTKRPVVNKKEERSVQETIELMFKEGIRPTMIGLDNVIIGDQGVKVDELVIKMVQMEDQMHATVHRIIGVNMKMTETKNQEKNKEEMQVLVYQNVKYDFD